MNTNWKALCAELADELDAETGYTRRLDGQRITHPTVARARAALSEPEPEGPTPADGEVQELVSDLRQQANYGFSEFVSRDKLLRTADLLAQRYPQPVPVSERLPGPEDCIPHPRTKLGNCCWGFGRLSTPPAGLPAAPLVGPRKWTLMYVETIELECSHWLPAHALPLPGEVNHG